MYDMTFLVDDAFPTQVFVNPMPARGVKRPRKSVAAKSAPKPKGLTRADLVALCEAKGLKALSAHTKGELEASLLAGAMVRPAAYDRQNKARAAKRPVQLTLEF